MKKKIEEATKNSLLLRTQMSARVHHPFLKVFLIVMMVIDVCTIVSRESTSSEVQMRFSHCISVEFLHRFAIALVFHEDQLSRSGKKILIEIRSRSNLTENQEVFLWRLATEKCNKKECQMGHFDEVWSFSCHCAGYHISPKIVWASIKIIADLCHSTHTHTHTFFQISNRK